MEVEVKGASVGFSFLTLIILLMAIVGHMFIFVGMFTEQASTVNFLVVTPISLLIFLFNALIVFGLRRRRFWAFLFGSFEMIVLIIVASVNIWSADMFGVIFSLFLMVFSISMLFALRNDFNEIKAQEIPHV
jgi:hypothetical protein